MFFKKKIRDNELSLVDIVPKVSKNGYIFWDINDDLGKAADAIAASTPLNLMAYAYARRAAMAALFVQGVSPLDHYEHAISIFKGIQLKTGTSFEFQELAAKQSEAFMQSYSHQINSFFIKNVINISLNYELPADRLIPDAALFTEVIDTVYAEQNELIKNS